MNSFSISLSTAALALCVTSSSAATRESSSSGLVVSADQMGSDLKTRTTTLKGNVQVVIKGQYLSCDQARIDAREKRIEASGHVRLQSPTVYAEASRMTLDYEADRATLHDGFIQSGQVVFEGKEIQKTGPSTYIATDAQYTSCVSCPPTWSFSGRRIEAELGGYAKISRPVMRIGGVPILILPGIMVPLKSARQSGFLVPTVEFSKQGKETGFALSESYFWAISRSQDMTLTEKYYQRRGPKELAEYRFFLDEASRGQIDGAYIQDQTFHEDYDLDARSSNIKPIEKYYNRWYYKYQHLFNMPNDYIQRVDLRQTSDLRYVRDFPDEVKGHADPALENKVSITKNFATHHASVEGVYNVNLIKHWPLADNHDAVHRLPEIKYSMLERRIGLSPFLFRFDGVYTNFARMDYSYDDQFNLAHPPPGSPPPNCKGFPRCPAMDENSGKIKRDGTFDQDFDLLRTGQRLDIRPSISMPLNVWRYFEMVPRLSFRDMEYTFPLSTPDAPISTSQRYVEAEVATRTTFSGIFGDLVSPQGERIKHEFEPEITLSSIPWIKRSEHPFFGGFAGQKHSRLYEPISDADVYGDNKIQFDYEDRVFDTKIAELALTNRIIRKRWLHGLPDYSRIATFRLSQSYDLNEAKKVNAQPFSPVDGLLSLRLDNFETYTTFSYNPYAEGYTEATREIPEKRVTNISSRLRLFDQRDNFLALQFDRILLLSERNLIIDNTQTETLGIGAGIHTPYADLEGVIKKSLLNGSTPSWGLIANLKPPGNCWAIRFILNQEIGLKPSFHFNMAFDFGGEKITKMN
jgi:LPS-assembly protein